MLKDNFGRIFTYLRLSVTEACNFKCTYCLPNGYCPPKDGLNELSVNEIKNLLAGFVELGIKKVRLTGGEPCLRKDLNEIIQTTAKFDAIERIALTTNGTSLHKNLEKYVASGVTALNLSVDSLNRDKFKELTGLDKLPELIETIQKAQKLPLQSLKMNAVLMKGHNDGELSSFLEFLKDYKVTMRFIELMQTNTLKEQFLEPHQMLAAPLIEKLITQGWIEQEKTNYAGPAREFKHPDYKGKIGFITPYGLGFCESCNRLRVSSQGQLQLCLFGQSQIDLRPFLQKSSQKEDLKNIITSALTQKDETHHLHEKDPGIRGHLASIGG
ncbi:MAG: GTP 3',8-cyclase MoaA [Alphaproteobacteria bacterium]